METNTATAAHNDWTPAQQETMDAAARFAEAATTDAQRSTRWAAWNATADAFSEANRQAWAQTHPSPRCSSCESQWDWCQC